MKVTVALLGIAAIALICGDRIFAQDDPVDPPDTPVVKLYGGARLLPPEGAVNTEATGSAKLLQWGERMAIHVSVRHLEPGATYDVIASKADNPDATLGTITTHDDVVPDPTVFKACLRIPPPEEPAEEEGTGDKHWRHGDWMWQPTGLAIFKMNEEKTEASFDLFVMGGTITSASVVFGTGDPVVPVVLTLDEENEGTVAVSADQYAAMKAKTAVLTVTITVKDSEGVETTKDLKGTLKPLFERFFEYWVARRAGTGALRLDTEREDVMPFGVTTIADLAGITISVKETAEPKAVVLVGTVGEIHECTRPTRHKDMMDGATFTGDDEETLAYADSTTFFGVGERHDASFIRGDANDDRVCDLADSIHILTYLYVSGSAPYSSDAADANDSGSVDLSDVIGILTTLFQGGDPLPAPGWGRGFDHSVDELSCEAN
jgi:hypothetical protein